jgi:hypothetical protein
MGRRPIDGCCQQRTPDPAVLPGIGDRDRHLEVSSAVDGLEAEVTDDHVGLEIAPLRRDEPFPVSVVRAAE